MKTVFSYVFDLRPADGEPPAACFERLVAAAGGWAAAEVGGGYAVAFDGRPADPFPGCRVTADRRPFDPAHELVTLDLLAPDRADPRLVWGCTTELARTPLGLQAAVALRVGLAGSGVAPSYYQVHRPGVIDALLKAAPGSVQGQPIPTRPRTVGEAFVPGFVRDTLTAPNRVLPVVVVSPDPQTNRPVADVDALAAAVLGLAEVVVLSHTRATFALTNEVGKEWSCFLGAVRVYWPGLDPETDDFRRHWIYFADHIRDAAGRDPVERQIFRRLVAAGSLRFSEAPLVRLARSAEERQRQDAFQRQLAKLKAGEQAADEVLRAWDAAQAEIARLRDDLAAAQSLAAEYAEQLQAVREQFEVVSRDFGRPAPPPRPAGPAPVRRVADAVRRAAEEFADVLEFLPSATDSAAVSPYQRPDRLYELLRALGELGREWRDGRLGRGWFHALRDRGFEYKDNISQTSAGKYGTEYTFVYDGRPLMFENHVTLGVSHNPQECLSVHWYRDETRKRIAVGWCGKHLTNTTT